MGAGNFPGTQQYANNAIGTENYIQQGGLASPINQQNQNIQGQIAAQNQQLLSQQNPYLAQQFNAAAQPVEQAYRNVTAPNILANAAQTGTVGGSGEQNAFNLANKQLATGLADLSANIYGPAWEQSQGLANQNFQQGLGYGNQNFQQGLSQTQEAALAAPSLTANAYTPANEMMQSGATAQNQAQNVLNTAYQNLYSNAQWPYQELNMLGGGLGNYPGQGNQKVTVGGGGSMK